MTVKVALVISDKNYRASPSGKGSIRKVQTGDYEEKSVNKIFYDNDRRKA